jgi:hypothetical protein
MELLPNQTFSLSKNQPSCTHMSHPLSNRGSFHQTVKLDSDKYRRPSHTKRAKITQYLHSIPREQREEKTRKTKGAKISKTNSKLSNASSAVSRPAARANTSLLESVSSLTVGTDRDNPKQGARKGKEVAAPRVQTPSNLKALK